MCGGGGGGVQACVYVVRLKPTPYTAGGKERTQVFFLPVQGNPSSPHCGFLPHASPLLSHGTLLLVTKRRLSPATTREPPTNLGCAVVRLSSDDLGGPVSDRTGRGLRLPPRPLLTAATAASAGGEVLLTPSGNHRVLGAPYRELRPHTWGATEQSKGTDC